MKKLTPSAPTFWIPVPDFVGLWGLPKGTGVFKVISKEVGINLPLSDKVLRHFLYDPRLLSGKSTEKLTAFSHEICKVKGFDTKVIDEIVESCKGRKYREIPWRGLYNGLRLACDQGFFPKSFAYVENLLDEEAASHERVSKLRKNTRTALKAALNSNYFSRYARPLSAETLQKIEKVKNLKEAEALFKTEEMFRTLVHGVISLQMDILSHIEVEWLSELLRDRDDYPFKSHFAHFLPTTDEGSIQFPIPRLFRVWRDNMSLTSWESMVAGMDDSYDKDRLRKLKGWLANEHIPSEADGDIEAWIEHLMPEDEYGYSRYIDLNYFRVAVFFTGLIKEMQKPSVKKIVSEEDMISAFATYNDHFARHKEAASQS